jgi:pimeloyl-ACP methyl ester carboxylesterase
MIPPELLALLSSRKQVKQRTLRIFLLTQVSHFTRCMYFYSLVYASLGGPGGSGVDAVLTGHTVYTEKLGDQFNIIGFDPRGVNNSVLSVSCFPKDPINTIAQNIFFADVFNPVRNDTLERGFAKAGAYGDWCTSYLAENGTAGYANTVAVAHDMLRYIETAAKQQGSKPEDAKLWYYGISYGTVLGATYAALFPDRIERMIVDGVVDSEDYYNGQWHTALIDADAAVRSFFSYCYEAGPELCAFHQNATSEDALKQRYLKIFQSLEAEPIEVADPTLGIPPVTITWEDLSLIMFTVAYSPARFPTLALGLTDLEKGNATLLAYADVDALSLIRKGYDSREVRTQTSCIDANGRFNLSTIEQYEEHVNFLNKLSFFGGPFLSGIIGGPCRNLDIYPPESQVMKGMLPRIFTIHLQFLTP